MHLLKFFSSLFALRQYNNRPTTTCRTTVKANGMEPEDNSRNCSNKSLSFSRTAQVFARFSPLIGGPTLLPVHAEVIIFETDIYSGDYSITYENDGFSVAHRIDFIPKDPEELGTILKLVTMQNVPGIVRHRKFACGSLFIKSDRDSSDINIVPHTRIKSLLATDLSMKKFSIVLPLGEMVIHEDQRMTDIVRSPRCIVELVDKKDGMELNLLRNNCYSFALDVVSCLKL